MTFCYFFLYLDVLFCAKQVCDLASSYEQLQNNIEFDFIT